MRKDDAIRLRHMLEAAKDAEDFIKGKMRDDLRGFYVKVSQFKT